MRVSRWTAQEWASDGYLRAYDDDLDGVYRLVLQDAATAPNPRGEVDSLLRKWRAEQENNRTPRWLVGIWLMDRLIRHVHEQRWSTTWPTCPLHGSHPIWLHSPYLPTAMWTCRKGDVPLGRLGALREVLTMPDAE